MKNVNIQNVKPQNLHISLLQILLYARHMKQNALKLDKLSSIRGV